MPKATPLELSSEDRNQLNQISKSDSLSGSIKRRAAILLRRADGNTLREIADEFETSCTVINRWIQRYQKRAPEATLLETLSDKERKGRKKEEFSRNDIEWILRLNAERANSNESYAALERRIYQEAEKSGHLRLKDISRRQIRRIIQEF